MTGARRRSDADRNDTRVLAAAAELLSDPATVSQVSVAQIAERAGVGKATVVRSHGGKEGLLRALIQQRYAPVLAELDEEPEVPGDVADRLVRTLGALLEVKVAHRGMSLALEALGAGSPYDSPGYEPWRARIEELLVLAGAPDVAFAAHALLAAVRSDLIEHLLGTRGWSVDALRSSVEGLARDAARTRR